VSRITDWTQELTPWSDPNVKPTATDPYSDFDLADISEKATIDWNLAQQEALEKQREQRANEPDEKMTPDQIRVEIEKQQAANAITNEQERQFRAARTFCVEEPEYVVDQKNAKRMAAWLEARGLPGNSVDDYHQAFAALKAEGLLKVAVLPPQPRITLTERDLENMPIDQLRELADNEMRSRNAATRLVRNPRRGR
jgi:hypothetical protein